jgi:hypothetical protein
MRFGELAQNAENDEHNKWDIDDTRRPKLTLKQLNKMRGMREIAKTEHIEQVKQFKTMYGGTSTPTE